MGVLKKDGRFATPVYHLWHKITARTNEAANMERLQLRMNNPELKRAMHGVTNE